MKATELIKQLEKQVKKHGDVDVYSSYDQGILTPIEVVKYFKEIPESPYVYEKKILKNVIVMCDETEYEDLID